MVKHLELTVDKLLLDEENPRLGWVGSQTEALGALIDLSPTHFENMMISIVKEGLDPGDSFYVIKAEVAGKYIVLDGNRRLSALKVLSKFDALDGTGVSEKIRKRLTDIELGFDVSKLQKIRCVCFKSRAEAKQWIEKRHTGSKDGEGRINWIPPEIQRFSGDRFILDMIDFVERNGDFAEDEWKSTRSKIENRKWSTIGRLLESPIGREHIGVLITIELNGDRTPQLTRDPRWAVSVLKKIIEDVRDGKVNSRSLNKTQDINSYFKKLPKELRFKGKSVKPKAFKDIDIKTSQNLRKKPTKPGPKTKSAPRRRTTLAPPRHPFRAPKSERGMQLLREAEEINVKNLTISSAFVLRAFVELAVNDYMDDNNLSKKRKGEDEKMYNLDLSEKAGAVTQHIIENDLASKADMRGFSKNVVNKSGASSIQSLNDFVHNRYHIPTSEALISGWEYCVPVFVAAYGKV